MNTVEDLNTLEAKALARAEILAYREKNARERAAKVLADRSAEQEIAGEISVRRQREAELAAVRAERDRIYALREIELERQRQAAPASRATIADSRERVAAKALRRLLGEDFNALLDAAKGMDWSLFRIEIRRVLDDERAEVIHQAQLAREAARLAEAAVVPEPEDAHELLILAHHGLTQG